jgi:putative ABC transport system permease protein
MLSPRRPAWFPAQLTLAARRLSRAKGFAALAVATLALGIGINTSMFALADALLFRPPVDVAHPERVVALRFRVGAPATAVWVERCDYPTFVDIRRDGAFAAVAAYTTASVSVGVGPDANVANAMLVSRDFFRVL